MKKNLWIKTLTICFTLLSFLSNGLFASAQALLRDTEFNNNLSTTNSETRCMYVIEEGNHRGKLLAGGFFNSYNGNFNYSKLVRLNDDGTVDATFASQSYNGGIYTIAIQPWDNKIIVGGDFTRTVSGVTYSNIMRLNEDGSVDNTFNATGGGTDGVVWKVLVLNETIIANRRIVIGGVYKSYKGSSIIGTANQGGAIMVRENGNLAKNLNVTEGAWTGGGVYCMTLDYNGDILIGGEFGLINGVKVRRAARLSRSGDLDPAFLNHGYDGVGPGGTIYTIAAQPADNKILIGGAFTTYVDMSIGQFVNNTRTRIARLNYDGYLDKDFNFGSGNFLSRGFNDISIRDFLVASNGKIYVGGNFTSYDGVAINRVVRLNRDGSIDNTLNIGSGFDNIVHDIAFYNFWRGSALDEAQILVAGTFSRYNGYTGQPNMVRLRNAEVLAASATNFTAIKVDYNRVRLQWRMTKANTDYQVQRSYDGANFQLIRIFSS
ncbi:MAG TPA: delta-60 repeat domain-containing protein, partial [Flavisolibacter sp.]|nr:delta-60 repeat domain-containing protein [Flavisolibacter sp.]